MQQNGWRRDRDNGAGRDLPRLFEREVPHAPDAEAALLGSMILDHRVIADVLRVVPKSEAFYAERHAAVFDALVQLYDKHNTGDVVQIIEALRTKDVLEEIGGAEYIVDLAERVPTAANWSYYAKVVRDKALLRKLIDACGKILFESYTTVGEETEDVRTVLDRAEQAIFELVDQETTGDVEQLNVLLQEALDLLDKNFTQGRTITGVASGFYDLDEMTSGLQKGELVIVAARPSMGKTAFALNLAEQIALHGDSESGGKTPVGFFSMEMSKQAVTQRLMCAHSGVDSHKMRRNMLSHEDFDRLASSCSVLAEAPVYIDDSPDLTVLMLRAKARRMVAQHGVRCIVIDYLQLMTAPGSAREGRQNEVSTISRGIKALARELNVPIVCLAQLNRGAEQREGHRPRMADLRESGSIEQDADVILLLHRESYYHRGEPAWDPDHPDFDDNNREKLNLAEVIIAKQRNGPTGTVELVWDAQTTRFRSYTQAPARHPQPAVPSPAQPETRRVGFAPGKKTGPISDHRDGGGPDRDADDIPI